MGLWGDEEIITKKERKFKDEGKYNLKQFSGGKSKYKKPEREKSRG